MDPHAEPEQALDDSREEDLVPLRIDPAGRPDDPGARPPTAEEGVVPPPAGSIEPPEPALAAPGTAASAGPAEQQWPSVAPAADAYADEPGPFLEPAGPPANVVPSEHAASPLPITDATAGLPGADSDSDPWGTFGEAGDEVPPAAVGPEAGAAEVADAGDAGDADAGAAEALPAVEFPSAPIAAPASLPDAATGSPETSVLPPPVSAAPPAEGGGGAVRSRTRRAKKVELPVPGPAESAAAVDLPASDAPDEGQPPERRTVLPADAGEAADPEPSEGLLEYESAVAARSREDADEDAVPACTGGAAWTLPLLCAGLGLLACCVVIPLCDANRRAAWERLRLRRDLESLQRQVATNDEFLRKVADDPSLAERLAQRQMRKIRAGTRVLPLHDYGNAFGPASDGSEMPSMSPFRIVAVPPPTPLPPYRPVGGRLATLCYNPHSRLYLMGCGLLMLASGLVLGYSPHGLLRGKLEIGSPKYGTESEEQDESEERDESEEQDEADEAGIE